MVFYDQYPARLRYADIFTQGGRRLGNKILRLQRAKTGTQKNRQNAPALPPERARAACPLAGFRKGRSKQCLWMGKGTRLAAYRRFADRNSRWATGSMPSARVCLKGAIVRFAADLHTGALAGQCGGRLACGRLRRKPASRLTRLPCRRGCAAGFSSLRGTLLQFQDDLAARQDVGLDGDPGRLAVAVAHGGEQRVVAVDHVAASL